MNKHELTALAERAEQATGILATEQCKEILLKAWKIVSPAPTPSRVPYQANGEPWSGDGLGPYTEEYSRWSARNREFRGFIDAGAFLDAAMTLVPERGFPKISKTKPDEWFVHIGQGNRAGGVAATAATHALALTAAALKALAGALGKD